MSRSELARYASLATEQPNPATKDLDILPTLEVLRVINREDHKVAMAVRRELGRVEQAVKLASKTLASGGRLFFFGAGTSGRLGVMEAAECPPTFGTRPGLIQAVMAGGKSAVFRSKEGAEDDAEAGKKEAARRVRRGDAVVGIAASGVTPFVLAALQQAKRRGASTILVTSNRRPVIDGIDVVICPNVGPEALTGSTRMKSATAAKMVLNMLTTASMVRLGRIYRNWMVALRPSSKKLWLRAVRLVCRFGKVSPTRAQSLLRGARGDPRAAILMARREVSYRQAVRLLESTGGFLRPHLEKTDSRS